LFWAYAKAETCSPGCIYPDSICPLSLSACVQLANLGSLRIPNGHTLLRCEHSLFLLSKLPRFVNFPTWLEFRQRESHGKIIILYEFPGFGLEMFYVAWRKINFFTLKCFKFNKKSDNVGSMWADFKTVEFLKFGSNS